MGRDPWTTLLRGQPVAQAAFQPSSSLHILMIKPASRWDLISGKISGTISSTPDKCFFLYKNQGRRVGNVLFSKLNLLTLGDIFFVLKIKVPVNLGSTLQNSLRWNSIGIFLHLT